MPHLKRFRAFVALVLFAAVAAAATPARAAGETIGSLKTVAGTAVVLRAGAPLGATPGLKLLEGDVLETGADGRLGAILRDDSLLSLGPSSRVEVESFMLAPAEGKLGLTVRVLRGTMAYLSGLIVRLAPGSASFVTPVATIGVRGTRFAVHVAE